MDITTNSPIGEPSRGSRIVAAVLSSTAVRVIASFALAIGLLVYEVLFSR